jgi:hypothetical protein
MIKRPTLVLMLLLLSGGALADDFVGQASVIDGDTLEIHGIRIRLWGVDVPESSQLCRGEDSSQYRCGAQAANDLDVVAAARDAENAVRFRRGWFLGDGTGAGKGRQVTGVLDNWHKGRRRAIWISKSDKLIDDSQRDWSALGMERLLVTPLLRFRQGTPIRLAQGVLFTTYVTLPTDGRGEKLARVRQIVEWLGSDFDGVIVFDESHAMQNAVGVKGERGEQAASQQGRAGLRLQHALPNARVVHVAEREARVIPRDASELADRLAREAEAVCRQYLSNGKREGRYWMVGKVHNTPGRSMYVRLRDSPKASAGKWTEYVAPRVMLRICDWGLSRGRLRGSTQHNASALREVA